MTHGFQVARHAVRRFVAALPAGARRPVRAVLHAVKPILVAVLRVGRWLLHVLRALPGLPQRLRSLSLAAVNQFSEWVLVRVAVPLGYRRTQARLAQGVPASLWGITPILTLPLKSRADQKLGFRSQSLVFTTYYITRNFDYNLKNFIEFLWRRGGGLIVPFERLLLAWAIWRYDVFHYFYDQGLTSRATRFGVNPRELDLLRAAGKRVYLYAYGADVRRRAESMALGKWNYCAECPEPGRFCACTDDNALIMAAMCAKVTCAVALGDMIAFVPNARSLNYWPIDVERVPPAPAPREDGPLRIAHAPNHTHFKGSHYLEATIEKLRGEGHAIEYVKVQGVPNEEVIRLFGEADLVADQFIGGDYGYTALEAMARGKPVLTYVRAWDLIEAVEECPFINATPDTLEQTLRWCLANRAKLPAIGAQGTAYVRRWHCTEAVAARFASMYEETADFPEATRRMIVERRAVIERQLGAIPQVPGWEHPFLVRQGDPSSRLGGFAA
ncbi:glycosyltransferase [Bosea thiooxidans]|nr:hypothetical protein [Bosea thiooxidans]